MKKQKDIQRLAKFMGWKWSHELDAPMEGSHPQYLFDPFIHLEDAMMVAEKIGLLSLCQMKPGGTWSASFDEEPLDSMIRESKTPAEAITLAALAYLDATEKR